MTRPRLSRRALNAVYTRAMAENADMQARETLRRINEIGALARLALAILSSPSPDTHPRLEELKHRRDALEQSGKP